ncbi:MAG: hypothetical protein J7L76_04810, partial [Spirochaetaceae bacterium]|nr:hypothetical protein [Spirochaetaceae bacterium]
MKNYLLGIDIGTSELKAGIIDDSGTVQASLQSHNSSRISGSRNVPQDVLSIVNETAKLIKNACDKAGIDPADVTAMGMD